MEWTAERVATWKNTGKTPGPVIVWTPQQMGAFLDRITLLTTGTAAGGGRPSSQIIDSGVPPLGEGRRWWAFEEVD